MSSPALVPRAAPPPHHACLEFSLRVPKRHPSSRAFQSASPSRSPRLVFPVSSACSRFFPVPQGDARGRWRRRPRSPRAPRARSRLRAQSRTAKARERVSAGDGVQSPRRLLVPGPPELATLFLSRARAVRAELFDASVDAIKKALSLSSSPPPRRATGRARSGTPATTVLPPRTADTRPSPASASITCLLNRPSPRSLLLRATARAAAPTARLSRRRRRRSARRASCCRSPRRRGYGNAPPGRPTARRARLFNRGRRSATICAPCVRTTRPSHRAVQGSKARPRTWGSRWVLSRRTI